MGTLPQRVLPRWGDRVRIDNTGAPQGLIVEVDSYAAVVEFLEPILVGHDTVHTIRLMPCTLTVTEEGHIWDITQGGREELRPLKGR